MRTLAIAALLAAALATPAIADEKPVQLKKAPGSIRSRGTARPVTASTTC